MFLDRSWSIRGGAADFYMPLITILRTVTETFHINEVIYSEKGAPLTRSIPSTHLVHTVIV